MNGDQITADFAAFGAGTTTVNVNELKERQEQLRKLEERVEKQVRPEQIKVAQKLAEDVAHDRDQKEKAKIYAVIVDYYKAFPDKLNEFPPPKHYGAKVTLEQLKTQKAEMERRLGQGGGLGILRQGYFKLIDIAEKYREHLPEGYNNLENAGKCARAMCDGSENDEVSPLLYEFSIKYASWFNVAVEYRLAFATANMLAVINQVNSQGAKSVLNKANTTPSSKATKDKLKNL